MQRLWTKTAQWPAEIDLVRNWLQPYLEQKFADAVVRAGDLDQLAQDRRRLRAAARNF